MALSLGHGWACDSCHDRWNGNEAVVTTKERPKKVMKFLSFYQNIHFCSADSPEAAVL